MIRWSTPTPDEMGLLRMQLNGAEMNGTWIVRRVTDLLVFMHTGTREERLVRR